ncbi:MAG: shikimate dehydrogenase [Clostridia bacterium]|nr:shikimate dehydrogenase [Clostridia bacterium]
MNKKHYGVIGHPIGHTLSPFIHTKLMKLSGINGDYSVFDIAPEDLSTQFSTTLAQLDGFNATIPHKQAVMKLADELDETAALYGSVNTIAFVKNGGSVTSKGCTTDGIGFVNAIADAGIMLNGTVTIIGCGGVGRVFANTCAKAGCTLNLLECESAVENTRIFADSINERFGSGTARVFVTEDFSGDSDLLINATPIGMYPNCDACAVGDNVISRSKAVFDAVYNPSETLIVKKARAAGIPALTGMTMLVYQAAAAQTFWNGSRYNAEDIAQIAKECFEELAKR